MTGEMQAGRSFALGAVFTVLLVGQVHGRLNLRTLQESALALRREALEVPRCEWNEDDERCEPSRIALKTRIEASGAADNITELFKESLTCQEADGDTSACVPTGNSSCTFVPDSGICTPASLRQLPLCHRYDGLMQVRDQCGEYNETNCSGNCEWQSAVCGVSSAYILVFLGLPPEAGVEVYNRLLALATQTVGGVLSSLDGSTLGSFLGSAAMQSLRDSSSKLAEAVMLPWMEGMPDTLDALLPSLPAQARSALESTVTVPVLGVTARAALLHEAAPVLLAAIKSELDASARNNPTCRGRPEVQGAPATDVQCAVLRGRLTIARQQVMCVSNYLAGPNGPETGPCSGSCEASGGTCRLTLPATQRASIRAYSMVSPVFAQLARADVGCSVRTEAGCGTDGRCVFVRPLADRVAAAEAAAAAVAAEAAARTPAPQRVQNTLPDTPQPEGEQRLFITESGLRKLHQDPMPVPDTSSPSGTPQPSPSNASAVPPVEPSSTPNATRIPDTNSTGQPVPINGSTPEPTLVTIGAPTNSGGFVPSPEQLAAFRDAQHSRPNYNSLQDRAGLCKASLQTQLLLVEEAVNSSACHLANLYVSAVQQCEAASQAACEGMDACSYNENSLGCEINPVAFLSAALESGVRVTVSEADSHCSNATDPDSCIDSTFVPVGQDGNPRKVIQRHVTNLFRDVSFDDLEDPDTFATFDTALRCGLAARYGIDCVMVQARYLRLPAGSSGRRRLAQAVDGVAAELTVSFFEDQAEEAQQLETDMAEDPAQAFPASFVAEFGEPEREGDVQVDNAARSIDEVSTIAPDQVLSNDTFTFTEAPAPSPAPAPEPSTTAQPPEANFTAPPDNTTTPAPSATGEPATPAPTDGAPGAATPSIALAVAALAVLALLL